MADWKQLGLAIFGKALDSMVSSKNSSGKTYSSKSNSIFNNFKNGYKAYKRKDYFKTVSEFWDAFDKVNTASSRKESDSTTSSRYTSYRDRVDESDRYTRERSSSGNAEIDELQDKIDAIKEQLKEVRDNKPRKSDYKGSDGIDRDAYNDDYKRWEEDKNDLRKELRDAQKELKELQKELKQQEKLENKESSNKTKTTDKSTDDTAANKTTANASIPKSSNTPAPSSVPQSSIPPADITPQSNTNNPLSALYIKDINPIIIPNTNTNTTTNNTTNTNTLVSGYNPIASNHQSVQNITSSKNVIQSLGGGNYTFTGSNKAEGSLSADVLSPNAVTLDKNQQLQILNQMGIDTKSFETGDSQDGSTYFKTGNNFFRVVNDNNQLKVIYTIMDENGQASTQVYKVN